MNSVEYLLANKFSLLAFQMQQHIKKLGRPTPEVNIISKSYDGKVSRKFSQCWFEKIPWLTASCETNKLYCWPCLLFAIDSNEQNVWSRNGYKDMKNLSTAIKKHQSSKFHLDCVLRLKLFGTVRIDEAISQGKKIQVQHFNDQVSRNREIMKRLIDTVVLLGRQGISFRGHNECASLGNRGNYLELIDLLKKYDQPLRDHLESEKTAFKGTSKTIQNDIIESINHVIDQKISSELNESDFIAVECDECTDVSNFCQLSLVCRYVNKEGTADERFLGFIDVSKERSAEKISSIITYELNKVVSKLSDKLIGQAYDGAAVFSGKDGGVQKKIRSSCPMAVFIHCYAHKLNLVLLKGTDIDDVQYFFSGLNSFNSFFSHSPKRLALFRDIQTNYSLDKNLKLVAPSDTRWSYKGRAVHAILQNFDVLKEMCETISTRPEWLKDYETINISQGLSKYLENFNFVFLLVLYDSIFIKIELLSQLLQSKTIDFVLCINQIKETIEYLNGLRREDKFETFLNKTTEINGDDIQASHRRKRRARGWANFESGYKSSSADTPTDLTPKDEARKLYFSVIDNLLAHLNSRFSDMERLSFFSLLDHRKFKEHNNIFPEDLFQSLLKIYPIFDELKLKNELRSMWSTEALHLPSAELLTFLMSSNLTDCFDQLTKFIKIHITLPLSSASVERSFSCLKRIKNYLRNTMSQERMTSLSKMSIESDLVFELQQSGALYEGVIEYFSTKKERKIDLLYK